MGTLSIATAKILNEPPCRENAVLATGSFVQQYVLANDPWWEAVSELDVFLRQVRAKHGRNGHAERAALLRVLQQVPFAKARIRGWGGGVSGFVHLFITRCRASLASLPSANGARFSQGQNLRWL